MNLLNEIVANAVKGIHLPFKLSHWDGSEDGHPTSLHVDRGTVTIEGPEMHFSMAYTIAESFENPGAHTLSGSLALPHGPSRLILDDMAVPDGRIVIVPHLKGKSVRLEVLFYCPEPGNPLHHVRFDADLARA